MDDNKKQYLIDRIVLNVVLFVINIALIWSGIAITQKTNYKTATYGYTLIILPFVMNFFLNYALYREQPDKLNIKSSKYVVPAVVLDILAVLQYLFIRGAF